MFRTLKDVCLKVAGAVYRFAATPGQSLWLALVLVMTFVVWRVTYATIGAAWDILPPIAVIPVFVGLILVVRSFVPPFRPLKWLTWAAVVVGVAWLLQYLGVLPQSWHLDRVLMHHVGVRHSLVKLVPTGLFLLTAVLGRSFFVRPLERWVIGWNRTTPKERRIGWRLFDHFAIFNWGPYKVSSDKFWLRLWFACMRTCAALTFIAAMAFPFVKSWSLKNVTYSYESVIRFDPPVATTVRSSDGQTICRFAIEDREIVSLSQIPMHVRQAFIAAEDKNFYQHDGIDPVAIIRALRHHLATGRNDQGASTLTQQVIKQLVLRDSEKTKMRKLREWFLAVELEKDPRITKDKILEVYLNHIFLGRAYGIQAAARAYYGKNVGQLSIGEAAFLGGMPKRPSGFSPSMHYARAKQRQAYVLRRMTEQGFITEAERKAALAQDVAVIVDTQPINVTAAPYFCAFIYHQLKAAYGEDTVFKKGLYVESTLNLKMQEAAEAAVRNGLIDLERKLGFNGPTGHDNAFKGCGTRDANVRDGSIEIATVAAVVPGVSVCIDGEAFRMHPEDQARIESWQRKGKNELKVGDTFAVKVKTFVRAKDMPKGTPEGRFATSAIRTAGKEHPEALQAALLSIDPATGFLRAMVGGYDFNESQYNSAVQGHRQPGSSIKPYVYLRALQDGMVVTDTVNDHPVCYPSASGQWCPENYKSTISGGQQYFGTVDLRMALAKSLNSVSAQLAAKAGIDNVIATMRALGINSPIQRVLPIAVGALDLTVWEHTAAYAGIAAGGKRLPSQFKNATPGIFITKVIDMSGKVLYAYEPKPMAQAVPSGAAYALIHLMKGVVEFGTGHRVKELGRPAAGKTGTTNDFKDAWFMGYTADLVTGVWVGRMTPTQIAKEATGGAVALPIWLGYMQAAHPKTPPREFSVPDDIIMMTGEGGKPVPFQRGRLPAKYRTKKSE